MIMMKMRNYPVLAKIDKKYHWVDEDFKPVCNTKYPGAIYEDDCSPKPFKEICKRCIRCVPVLKELENGS